MHFYLIIHHIVILFSVCVYLWIVCGCSECDEKNKNKKYIEKGRKVEPLCEVLHFSFGRLLLEAGLINKVVHRLCKSIALLFWQ